MANQLTAFPKRVAVVLCLLSVAGAGCWPFENDSESGFPYEDPGFLTPLAQAQEVGIRPYWVGKEFEADGLVFGITPEASYYEPPGAAVHLRYVGYGEERGGRLSLETYPRGGTREAQMFETVRRSRGAVERAVQAGTWEASLWTLTAPGRAVNGVVLFVGVGDMTVMAMAKSGTSGVPGDDWNPLIDEDLLIDVVAENLRPYPE